MPTPTGKSHFYGEQVCRRGTAPETHGGKLGDKSCVLVPFVNVQSHCFAQIALIRATGAQAAVTVREVGFHLISRTRWITRPC